MSQPCQDPIDTAPHSIYQSMFRRSGTQKSSHSCTDLLLDHLVYLIMCNIQEPGDKAAVTANNSLLTCSHTPAFNTFNFLSVTLSLTLPPLFVTSQPDTPLLLLPLGFPPPPNARLSSLPSSIRVSLRHQSENVAVQHPPYPQITVTFHARGVSQSWAPHTQVQGYARNDTPSSAAKQK